MQFRPSSQAPATGADLGGSHALAGICLSGFCLSGFLLALTGAILPAWGYHRDPPEFGLVGAFFLCLAVGLAGSVAPGRRILERRGLRSLLVFACGLACASLVFLAFVSPPVSAWWRAFGLMALGFAAGLLNMALFHAFKGGFEEDAAGLITRGGAWFGGGCLAATLIAGGAADASGPYHASSALAVMALAPAGFLWRYVSRPIPETRLSHGEPKLRQVVEDFRSPAAILFALLLFFQFGNEWSIAGWLPVFLIRRLGLSPRTAVLTLALYWFFLLAGRLLAVAILPRVRHGRLLLGSAGSALFGCLILFSTENAFGAASAVFFVGAGYASVYPLVAEAIGRRFPYYHPGFFNGIFSLALLGGLLAPASLGWAAAYLGAGVVVGIPLIGTFIVVLLIAAIRLEAKVTGK